MPTLLAEQKRLASELTGIVYAAWGLTAPAGFSEPTDEKSLPCEGKPKAFILLGSATPGEDTDGGSFCSDPVLQNAEIVLRECPPKTNTTGLATSDSACLSRAQQVRAALGLTRSLGTWNGWTTRWLGETYRDSEENDADALTYVTLRVRLAITLEVSLS